MSDTINKEYILDNLNNIFTAYYDSSKYILRKWSSESFCPLITDANRDPNAIAFELIEIPIVFNTFIKKEKNRIGNV